MDNKISRICPKCGYNNAFPQQSDQALSCGSILQGRYVVGCMLGQGGFGITYIGYDWKLETTVCIKEFFPRGMAARIPDRSGQVYWGSSKTAIPLKLQREAFVSEARKAVKVRSLSSLVNVWDVFYENETAYIIMEYIKGITVKEYLMKKGTPMDIGECMALLVPVIRDLQKVHELGIVHRDISPDNLMIREDGRVMLLDLGAAKDLTQGSGQSSTIVVKRGFSPFEQYSRNSIIGPWTDVYAMSATIYWCLTREVIPEATDRILQDTLTFPPYIPPNAAAVLRHGLAMKPEERIPDSRSLLEELESTVQQKTKSESSNPRNLPEKKQSASGKNTGMEYPFADYSERKNQDKDNNKFQDYPSALGRDSILLDRYIIKDVLDVDSLYISYKALDKQTGQTVAIKEFFPSELAFRQQQNHVPAGGSQKEYFTIIPYKGKDDFEYFKILFTMEARSLARFNGSPGIVKVENCIEKYGTAYVVMEYVQGDTLRKYVQEHGGRIAWNEAWSLLMPLFDALSNIHSNEIFHGDINPDKILITRDGTAKLIIEFGWSSFKYWSSLQLDHSVPLEMDCFKPIECYYKGGKQGPWTDVYALAATLYFGITGLVPPLSIERLTQDLLKKPSALGVDIPVYAESALLKALAIRAEDRFQSTYDFRNAVLEGGHQLKEKEEYGIDRVKDTEELCWQGGHQLKEKEVLKTYRVSNAPMALTDNWKDIISAGRNGTYKKRYRIGDTKELDMGFEGVITMKLVAMDEDELADGSGKAPMTWVADKCLRTKHKMNYKRTNKGGWEVSIMRSWLRRAILPLMPTEVRNNICEVIKYSYSYEERKGVASKDTIWIPSVREVFPAGYDDWTDKRREQEGVSYTGVIKDDESRMRSRDGESGASWWWLRSASSDFSNHFTAVSSDGDDSYGIYANREGGVVVGFCF